jgi:hypothetical protein
VTLTQPKKVRKAFSVRNEGRNPYLIALQDPFDPRAMGCQLPDDYPFPTATYHLHCTVQATCPAAGGTMDAIILPSPTLTYLSLGDVSSTNGYLGYPPSALGSGVSFGAMCSDTQLAGLGTCERVVAFGIKLKNNLNFSTVTGRIIVAPVIIPLDVFSNLDQNEINTNLCTSVANSSYLVQRIFQRLTGSANPSSGIEVLPGAIEFGLDELIGGEMLWSTRPVGPHGCDWRYTSNVTVTTTTLATLDPTDVVNTSGSVLPDSSPSQAADCGGLIGFLIHIEGAPAGTTPILIETICHMEVQPKPSGSVPTPSNNHKQHPAVEYMNVISEIAATPIGKWVTSQAASRATGMMQHLLR